MIEREREREGEGEGYTGIGTTPLSSQSLGQGLSKLNLIRGSLLLQPGYFYIGVFTNISGVASFYLLSSGGVWERGRPHNAPDPATQFSTGSICTAE